MKLLLTGIVIIFLSLIVFGTDAVLSLITFYQNLENPSARELAEGISDSIICHTIAGVPTHSACWSERQISAELHSMLVKKTILASNACDI